MSPEPTATDDALVDLPPPDDTSSDFAEVAVDEPVADAAVDDVAFEFQT